MDLKLYVKTFLFAGVLLNREVASTSVGVVVEG
jgi:hypothetical protein